jgi:hypothetical protein
MEAAVKPASPNRPARQRQRRLPLAQLLFAAAGVALLLVGGAYAFRFVSATAFHKERAFRVLDEIGSQLDNLQRTLANQLRLMPLELVGKQCAKEFAGPGPLSPECKEKRETYERHQRRLALQGPNVAVATVSAELFKRACSQVNRYGVALQPRDPGIPFVAFDCASQTEPEEQGKLLTVAFQGSLAETVEGFVSQAFFDEVLVALADGTVIATIPMRATSRSTEVQLHSAKVRRLGVINLAPMLQQVHATAEKKAGDSPSPLPSQPQTFSTKIADDSYRVFLRVVQPRYGTYAERDDGQPALRQERLYLVGLKREDLRAELASSLEPGGRFVLTILTLLAFLIWPLATLRSKSPDDPIAWTEAVACLASVVLIPAVLAIATVWVWSYQGLLAWADAGAERYAGKVAATLDRELTEGWRLLGQYRSLYREANPVAGPEPIDIAIRSRNGGGFVAGRLTAARCIKVQQDRTCIIQVAADKPGQWGGWSTFSSIFATDAQGVREGDRFTVYDPPLVKSDVSYANREYFRVLQKDGGWVVTDPITGKQERFVAQRIFSGSDGARVMQIAVPRAKGKDCQTGFCGIVTGSASVHSLAAAVSPPLLSYAVIDRNSGMVLFHSNDSRSLAENFFIETERNPQLLALSEVGQSGFFSGRYVGAGHRFFHLPLQDTTWSVVVFYSLKEVGDLPWHAVFTALAAYAGASLVLLLGSCLALWLWAKRNRKSALNIAAGFWIRGSSCSYARWGLALFALGLTFVTVYELWAEGPVSLITRIMWAVLVVATVAVLLQHRFAVHSICISLWLLLVSALPAAWMALGYHDVQVQGLLRDGLVGAAHDIQNRSVVIAGDLHRWLSSGTGRHADFPEPWRLTQPSVVMPVPGYAPGSCHATAALKPQEDHWAMCVFDAPPLATLISRRELDFWRRETWDASVQAVSQQRRIRLLGRMEEDRTPACRSQDAGELCTFRSAEGHSFKVSAEPATGPSGAMSADDDRRFDGVAGSLGNVFALLMAMLITWILSVFISRRLLGDGMSAHSHHATIGPPAKTRHGVVFYTRGIPGEDVDALLQGFRAGDDSVSVKRVNLATKALYAELAPDQRLEGRVLLTNLDIALADADRRRDILDALERLAENPKVQVLVLCRRSPIDQLYHPERYPESGAKHVLTLDESLRWDNVLQKFECRDVESMDAPRTHPYLSTVDHHRTWKLCTRSERLLLYELARGRLANPRNTAVIQALFARGLLKLDPWPKIADESFEAFVRTAETTDDLAQWQQEAQGAGRRVRSTIIAILLIALLIVVVWFGWSAGDKFKILSAVVAGAVAFMGQIGQAFNFVRSSAGAGARPSS